VLPEELLLHLEILCTVGDALAYSEEEGTIIIFKNLTVNRQREGVWEFDAGDVFSEGKSVRMAELRAEYLAQDWKRNSHFGGETSTGEDIRRG
jgi:hypothetical protein